jgi:hypothetical protein
VAPSGLRLIGIWKWERYRRGLRCLIEGSYGGGGGGGGGLKLVSWCSQVFVALAMCKWVLHGQPGVSSAL